MTDQKTARIRWGFLGYLAVLLAPLLLMTATFIDQPFLVVLIVILIFPLARLVFGSIGKKECGPWSAATTIFLNSLPFVYGVTVVVATASFLIASRSSQLDVVDLAGWTLSFWLAFVFGTCVAHTLLHHDSRRSRTCGHVLAGMLGYPILGYEHNRHHRFPGNTVVAEWPRAEESLWQFASRRASKILPESLGLGGLALRGDSRSATVKGMRAGCASTAATWLAFAWFLGWSGFVLYGLTVPLVAFSIQLVTYMQHWGLGDDAFTASRQMHWGWEDDCRFQNWITMGLSIHLGHHRDSRRPYFRLQLQPDSPRMPAGYVLLMFAAFVPPLWRRVMGPALRYWVDHPESPPSAGRTITCRAVYQNT